MSGRFFTPVFGAVGPLCKTQNFVFGVTAALRRSATTSAPLLGISNNLLKNHGIIFDQDLNLTSPSSSGPFSFI